MKLPLIVATLAVAMPAFAQSMPPGPPPGSPPDFQSMRAEHAQFEAEWAQCKTIADGTARATCYEKVHDENEAAMAKHAAERHRPPPQ
jgi:hypothetical protein